MDRLRSELERLFLPRADGGVRSLVIELVRPAGWQEVARVWQGVQADLDLPAPAIAVSGRDGVQLWLSFADGMEPARMQAFADALRSRYLRGVPAERVRIQQPQVLPPAQVDTERWSAFVAPDLAPLFADEPWLDHPPGSDAQADLLSRIASIAPDAFERVLRQLTTAPVAAAASDDTDPRTFLLSVMRDPTVDMHLRIEAAKALLSSPRA